MTVTVLGVLLGAAQLVATTAAMAAPLHDANGCAAAVPVVDGELAVEPTAPFRLYATWEPDVYGTADPRPFTIQLRATQAPGCPDSETFGTGPHAWHWWRRQQREETTLVRRVVLADAQVDVVYDHPGIIDGARATQLVLARPRLTLDTSAGMRSLTAGRDPVGILRITALSPTELDLTADGVADIVISDPVGAVLQLAGTPRNDLVDLALLDPRTCVSARLGDGDDAWTSPQLPAAVDCGELGSQVELGAGNDSYVGGPGPDHVCDARGALMASLGAGDDVLACSDQRSSDWKPGPETADDLRTIGGGSGDDVILSTWGRAVVRGGDGNDVIRTGRRGDRIDGDGGDDWIYSDAGRDVVHGGDGNDGLVDENYPGLAPALRGDDLLVAGPGDDIVRGNFGNDLMVGGPGRDQLGSRGRGAPRLVGGPGDDQFDTYRGSPTILGGAGRDYVNAGRVEGGRIDTGPGADLLWIRVQRGFEARVRYGCGAGIDWLYYAHSPAPSCERMRYCRGRLSTEQCGTMPWRDGVTIDDLQPDSDGFGPSND